MSKKSANLFDLCRRNFHMCSEEINDSAYNKIVRPHLEYASTFWNPYTNFIIDRLEPVQRRAAKFMLCFYDYHSTTYLIGNVQKSLQLDSLPHRRAVADL